MVAGRARRRATLLAVLGLAGAVAPAPRAPPAPPSVSPVAPPPPLVLPWALLRRWLASGAPNGRLGLVQGQHLFGRAGTGPGFLWSGTVRVRIPATLIRLGDDGWTAQRFPDGWWMETLRAWVSLSRPWWRPGPGLQTPSTPSTWPAWCTACARTW